MKTVFADSHYWIALTNRNDSWHEAALRAVKALGPCRFITTDEVLNEFLAGPSKFKFLRKTGAQVVRRALDNPN